MPIWMGRWTIALCQFLDNILVASHTPRGEPGGIVELVREVLQAVWGLPVMCDCITETQTACTGKCCGSVCKGMGVVLVRDEGGRGPEPSALKGDWSLHLGAPLLSPHSQYPGYLGAIFTGVLKNALPFAASRVGQMLSAAA